MSDHEDILTFWFGALDLRGLADAEHSARWFAKDAAFDRELHDRFAALHGAVLRGEREDWLGSARGRLAYLIVLDQLSRNLFRGTPGMFAADARALEVARDAIAEGDARTLGFSERSFLYLPLMHSEALEDQRQCVALFDALRDEQTDPELRDSAAFALRFAEQHRDIVARFGRFPHRNALLGRESTPEELAFLTQPGSSF